MLEEPSDEPSPTDRLFAEALANDADRDAVRQSGADDEAKEEVEEEFVPLLTQIRAMNIGEKLRFTPCSATPRRARFSSAIQINRLDGRDQRATDRK
ncbi:MAG: hypothetical protein R3A47_07345 [Polyangiales bacterium]